MKHLWHFGATGAALCFAAALAGCTGNSGSSGTDNSSTNPASTSGADNNATANTAATTAPVSGGAAALTAKGATFPALIYKKWFSDYAGQKGVKIDYDAQGSGAGIKALTDGTVDFAASDAPLSKEEAAGLPGPVDTLPTVAGAVVVAYNLPGAPKNLKMTSQAVADIFLGKVMKWNDPEIAKANAGASLPSTPINVIHRSDGSGTSYIFTNFLSSVSSEWKDKVGVSKQPDWPVGTGSKGNPGVTTSISGAPGSIGYVELAYAKQKGLSYASIQNKAGQFVEPTVDATTAAAAGAAAALATDPTTPIANATGAKAYPIAGFTYLMIPKSAKTPSKGAALKEFLKWAMTDGQKSAAALDYAPLPKAVADLNLKTIDTLK